MAVVQALNSKIYDAYRAFQKEALVNPMLREEMARRTVGFRPQLKAIARDIAEISPKKAEELVTKRGKFTEAGKEAVKKLLANYNLPQTATWVDVLQASSSRMKKGTDVLGKVEKVICKK